MTTELPKIRRRFCNPMERHYMTKAAANAATALSMAKELDTACDMAGPGWPPKQAPGGIQDLVQIINDASLKLIRRCKQAAYEIDGP
jgi:hypothetical protein